MVTAMVNIFDSQPRYKFLTVQYVKIARFLFISINLKHTIQTHIYIYIYTSKIPVRWPGQCYGFTLSLIFKYSGGI